MTPDDFGPEQGPKMVMTGMGISPAPGHAIDKAASPLTIALNSLDSALHALEEDVIRLTAQLDPLAAPVDCASEESGAEVTPEQPRSEVIRRLVVAHRHVTHLRWQINSLAQCIEV